VLTPGPSATDLVMPRGLRDGTTAVIRFIGADADPNDFGSPDLTSESEPVTDITALNGRQFIRFEIRFDVGPEPSTVEQPRIEALSIRFHFE